MKAKPKFKIEIIASADGVGINIETYEDDVKLLTIVGALDLAKANFIQTHFTTPKNKKIKPKQDA